MGKSNKKKAAQAGGLAGLAGGALGNIATELVTEGAERLISKVKSGKSEASGKSPSGGKGQHADAVDAGLMLLRALDGRGARRLSRVIAAAGAGVSPALAALTVARDFGLVRLVGKDRVRLTRLGRETLDALGEGGEEPLPREKKATAKADGEVEKEDEGSD